MTEPRTRDSLAPGESYIQIDYRSETADAARIFRTMAKLMDAFYAIDRDLARNISSSLEPTLLLERVEPGSIRAIIRTVLREIDDEALKNLDWKPLIGHYLVDAKHRILRWLDGREHIQSRSELSDLQAELALITPSWRSDILLVQPIPAPVLLEDIRGIADATRELEPGDRIRYVSTFDENTIASKLTLTSDEIEKLLVEEVSTSQSQLTLLVKKPDYLGNSMWEFRYQDHTIDAKITDEPWLSEFQNGKVLVPPGSALKADVLTEVYRGFEGNVVGVRYTITRVLGVIPIGGGHQEHLAL